MRLKGDDSALESIPLRLMIIALVVSMSIIPASEALGTLRNGDFIRRAEAQLEVIVSTAEVLALEGPGGTRTVELDFSSDGSLRFKGMIIGDSTDGPNASAVVLILSNGGKLVRSADNPPVVMNTNGSSGLYIDSPWCCLRLSCDMADTCFRVIVESV